jgi:outer membrane protein assembly factor BamB
MAALDHQGKITWRKELPRYAFDVAIGCSPMLFEDTILLQADMLKKQSSLIAFDKKTGEIKWEAKRPETNFAHGTPTLITLDAKPLLLVAGSDSLQGVDPRTGEKLWTAKAKGDTVSPVFADGIAYIDSGRGGPGFAFAIDQTLKGDVSKSALKWNLKNVPEAFGSPIIVNKRLYRLQGSGILKGYSLTDGSEIFSKRLEGAAAAVSPVSTADGVIYFASSGKSYVIKDGATFEQLGSSSLDDGNYASPAISDGCIFLKGQRFLYCIGKKQ